MAAASAADPRLFTTGESLRAGIKRLTALPGIGEWTACYIAMRALREPDAFPAAYRPHTHARRWQRHKAKCGRAGGAAEAWRIRTQIPAGNKPLAEVNREAPDTALIRPQQEIEG
jgi:AraC family transcriptional regulator, regulatory protein of adaptative response / DNA-3-methyladenine glycosylase II